MLRTISIGVESEKQAHIRSEVEPKINTFSHHCSWMRYTEHHIRSFLYPFTFIEHILSRAKPTDNSRAINIEAG